MRIEQLNYFVAVVNCGSMNKAAKKFFISQPALSAAITALEEELGFTLIKRNRQGISLTDSGKKIYEDSLHIIDAVKNWHYFNQEAQAFQETIVISTAEAPRYLILPSVIDNLDKNYPNIHLLIEKLSMNYSKLTSNENYDIFISAAADNTIPEICERFQADLVYTDYYCAFINTSSHLAKKPFVTMDDLFQEKLVLYCDSNFNSFIDECAYPHNKIFYSRHKEAVMAAVGLNNYVTIFQSMRQYNNYYVDSGQICLRPIIDNMVRYDHFLIYPSNNRITPSQKITVNYIKDAYANFSLKTLPDREKLFAPTTVIV